MPAGGNLEEMLKEHEKQMQHGVRKARIDKAKINKTQRQRSNGVVASPCEKRQLSIHYMLGEAS